MSIWASNVRDWEDERNSLPRAYTLRRLERFQRGDLAAALVAHESEKSGETLLSKL